MLQKKKEKNQSKEFFKMKSPICQFCGYSIKRTVGLMLQASTVYYLNQESHGHVSPTGYLWQNLWKLRRPHFISFYCRGCKKEFTHKMEKEIRTYLKSDHLLNALTKKNE